MNDGRDTSETSSTSSESERGLILLLSMAWFLGASIMVYRMPTGAISLPSILRIVGVFLAGPVTIRFLFAGEENKLITLLVVTLAVAGSVPGGIKDAGLLLRWVMLGAAAVVGFDAFFRRPGMVRTFPHVVIFAWATLALVSSTYAVRNPRFAFEKSISVYFLFGAAMLYAYDRFGTPRAIESALGTLGKLTAAFFAANFLFLFSNVGYLAGRFRGITENPNTLGGFFTVTMAPMIYVTLRSIYRRQGVKSTESLVYLAMTLGSLLLLFRSGSRAGLLGAFVGSAIYMLLAERDRFVKIMLVVVPLIMVVLVAMPNQEAPGSILAEEIGSDVVRHLTQTTASGRFEAWDVAMEYILESPLIGQGWGTTRFLFDERLRAYAFKSHYGAHAHNSYLELTLELGVPFALAFVSMLLFVVAAGLRTAWRVKDHAYRSALAALVGALCGGLVGATWESWLIAVGSFGAFNFWMVLAILTRANRLPHHVWIRE